MFLPEKTPAVATPPSRERDGLADWQKLMFDAANLIEQHGWCQNDYRSHDGRLCLLGAMRVALGEPIDRRIDNALIENTAERLYHALGKKRAFQWNDEPGRTQAEVVAKLRAVALGG